MLDFLAPYSKYIAFLTAPLVWKIFAVIYKQGIILWKKWREKVAARKITGDMFAIEMEKLRAMENVDTKNIRRDDFQIITDSYSKMAQNSAIRAEQAEIALEGFKKKFNGFFDEFENLKEECKKNETVRVQLEQAMRMLCDTFKIAHWAITPEGHLEGNYTFFKTLTGLTAEECHNDGWFEAIEESERETVKELWSEFLHRSETKPQFNFTFVHKHTKTKIKTKVFCLPVFLDGLTVYKFTAQTAPLQIN